MSSRSRIQLEQWLKTIDVKGRVLDVGGSQNPVTPSRTKSWDVSDYKILDLSEPHEQKKEPDMVMDIQLGFVGGQWDQYEKSFDQVFCIEVSEYWYDPVSALKHISHFMKKGAELYISFHWLYGLHPPHRQDCLRYTRYAIEKLMQEVGLEIKQCVKKEVSDAGYEHLKAFYLSEGMRIDREDLNLYDEGYLIKAIKI